MPDLMDNAQVRSEQILAEQIRVARQPIGRISAIFCMKCDVAIPAARRAALPGVEYCITCQEIREATGKHYQSKA